MSQENTNKHKDDPESDADDEKKSNSDGGLKKVVQDIGVIGLSKILLSLSGIVILPILTKNLGAHGYGLWVQALATIGILTPIMRLGLPYATTRIFPSKYDLKEIGKDFSSITFLILLISISISTALFLYPSFLANAIFEGNTLIVKIVAILLFIRCLDELFITVFRAFREMKKYAVLEVTTRYAEYSLAAGLVIMGYGIVAAILALVLIRGLLFIVLLFLISRKLKFSRPKLSRTKEYLDFGIPLIPSDLSVWLVSTSDRYIIGLFLGATFVGYYNPGYTVGMAVPAMVGGVFIFVLTPTFSQYYEKNEMTMIYRVTNYCLKYFLVISFLYLIGAIIFGKDVLELLTTATIAEEGYVILIFTAITGLFSGVYTLFSRYIILNKRTKLMASFWIFASILNVVGNIYLIPRIGIIGAAITTVSSYFLLLLLALGYSLKNFDISIKLSYLPKLLLSSGLTALFLIILNQYIPYTNIYIDIPLGSVFYLGLVWVLNVVNKEEISFLKSMASKK